LSTTTLTDRVDMTDLENELAEALENLIDAVNDIRGLDVEGYRPNEFKRAYEVLSKYRGKYECPF
jgi:hypothetical protein